jgi:hypothetical protein
MIENRGWRGCGTHAGSFPIDLGLGERLINRAARFRPWRITKAWNKGCSPTSKVAAVSMDCRKNNQPATLHIDKFLRLDPQAHDT